MLCSSTRSTSNVSRGSTAFKIRGIITVHFLLRLLEGFLQTFILIIPSVDSVRLMPSEIVRESLLCCTWQLMESRNLRSIIKNFPFKFSSWERWQLPVSWLVLMKIQELQDAYELNVINKRRVLNMIIEQIIQIILQLSVNICKHFVTQRVLQFTSCSLSGSKKQEIGYMNGCDFAWHALCSIFRILKLCRRCVGQVSAVGNQEFFAAVPMESILDLFPWRDSP
jgi:hypothetical protein